MHINYAAVVVAAVSSFVLGGPWYSKFLFKQAWMRAAGFGENMPTPEQKHPAYVFGTSFLASLIAAFVFARWLGANPPLEFALKRGLMAGAGLVATSLWINFSFSNRKAVLWAIDAGYHVVQFLLFGLILGAWH